MKHYYAITYLCGLAVNSNGERYGTYHRFDSASERDEWVESGGDFSTGPDWREAIPTRDSELRSLIYKLDFGYYHPSEIFSLAEDRELWETGLRG